MVGLSGGARASDDDDENDVDGGDGDGARSAKRPHVRTAAAHAAHSARAAAAAARSASDGGELVLRWRLSCSTASQADTHPTAWMRIDDFVEERGRVCAPQPPDHAAGAHAAAHASEAFAVVEERRVIRVVRDDLLLAGTKERADARDALADVGSCVRRLVYAGPALGYAQAALARAALLTGRRACVFVPAARGDAAAPGGDVAMSPITRLSARLGACVHLQPCGATLAELRAAARGACGAAGRDEEGDGAFHVPLGWRTPAFVGALAAGIERALDSLGSDAVASVRRVWVACGSLALASALRAVFPDAYLLLVRVGVSLPQDVVDALAPAHVFAAPETFAEPAGVLPPYASLRTYDAKVWRFVLEHGRTGDLVWNVAADVDDAALARADALMECVARR